MQQILAPEILDPELISENMYIFRGVYSTFDEFSSHVSVLFADMVMKNMEQ